MSKHYTSEELLKFEDKELFAKAYDALLSEYDMLQARYDLLAKLYKRNTVQLIRANQQIIDSITGEPNSKIYELIDKIDE